MIYLIENFWTNVNLNFQIINRGATKVNVYLTECLEIMLEYELELEVLIDAILLIRRGLIYSKIFTPKKLFNNLKETYYVLSNKRLPILLESNEFTNLIVI